MSSSFFSLLLPPKLIPCGFASAKMTSVETNIAPESLILCPMRSVPCSSVVGLIGFRPVLTGLSQSIDLTGEMAGCCMKVGDPELTGWPYKQAAQVLLGRHHASLPPRLMMGKWRRGAEREVRAQNTLGQPGQSKMNILLLL